MGGHAYVIPLLATDELQHPRIPAKTGFWDRLRKTDPQVQVADMGRTRLFTYPKPGLDRALVADLREWIAGRFPHPSEATKIVLEDYLAVIEPDVFIRATAEAGKDPSEFYAQIGFSGCAGVAEVSARVVGHWTAAWYTLDHARIEEQHLKPAGLLPAPHDPHAAPEHDYRFMPAGDLGYLEYEPPDDDGAKTEIGIDVSIAESREGDPRLERLEDLVAPVIAAGRCLCQLCNP